MHDTFLLYKKRKSEIKNRLKDFRKLQKANNKDIFSELSFCILTPQSKALSCDTAVRRLKRSGLLFNGTACAIRANLKGVRFPNNKAAYLVHAREFLKKYNNFNFKKIINHKNPFATREWLIKNIKGLGYKEASHFLRNIGLGKDLAILDVHVLRNLKRIGVIKSIPKAITKNNYMGIENKMRHFSRSINIPLEELDLLFWSEETGFIFK